MGWRQWEGKVEERVWAGISNTKDFMKESCRKLFQNHLKYKLSYN